MRQRAWFGFLRATLAALLVGCGGEAVPNSEADGPSSGEDDGAGAQPEGEDDTESARDSGTADASPYANVVAVSASGERGDYTFLVSVESADVDCTQYADWWEVVSRDGELLYRRILEHSHTDANGTSDADAPGNTFTRSGGPVPVSGDDAVVVRAHINVGGYRGLSLSGSVATGFGDAEDLGAAFAPELEQVEPLPTTCLF
jgi:hypothetical protein